MVVKIPRFAFEKFPGADPTLTTHMKSVGEAMAIGRSFAEALQKAQRSLESQTGPLRFTGKVDGHADELLDRCRTPHDGRLNTMLQALRAGATPEAVAEATGVDPWFVEQLENIKELSRTIAAAAELDQPLLRAAKAAGFSDAAIADLRVLPADEVRALRHSLGVRPVYHAVDTCAAEFAARTPYLYSTYDEGDEVPGGDTPKVIILGSGPNRIGQGIEFDYSCVHASIALRAAGYETVMVNCNPETVSTDYDTSSRLYFEPLTLEDVLEVVHAEQRSGPVAGVIVQLGGQTPLGLARALEAAGVPIVGTSPAAIHAAEDRGAFAEVLAEAGLTAPLGKVALSARRGGGRGRGDRLPGPRPALLRARRARHGDRLRRGHAARLRRAAATAARVPTTRCSSTASSTTPSRSTWTRLYDGQELYLGGVMEHIEEAGIHSGDSACALPPITLGRADINAIREATLKIARGVGVRGLLNVQYALAAGVLYVLEANPRASRTVPFVSKATAVPLGKAAALVMMGASIASLRASGVLPASGDGGTLPLDSPVAVKEAVLPFGRFRDASGAGVDTVLGPEMRSTGEVMGIDDSFGTAFAKSQEAVYGSLPVKGRVFVSVANRDKRAMVFPVKRLADLGFEIWATSARRRYCAGTAFVPRSSESRATVPGRQRTRGQGADRGHPHPGR